jgi:GNAT superfamily N-acetyltransferase
MKLWRQSPIFIRERLNQWCIITGKRYVMKIVRLYPKSPEWSSLVTHLKAHNDARWVLDENEQPKPEGLIFFVVLVEGEVVGSLSLVRQEITIPETEWAGDRDRILRDPAGDPLYETQVQTFRVDEVHRRRGFGSALQEAAFNFTRETGCIQMRSWSSLEKHANYQIKLSLGFGFHPAVQVSAAGQEISGGYFVKRV